MKRFAANILLCKEFGLLKNAMIEIDDDNILVSISLLSSYSNEPASTIFFNGVITVYPNSILKVGDKLFNYENLFLQEGIKVSTLALWQNISLEELIVTEQTTITTI